MLGWRKPTLSTRVSTRFVSDRAADPQNSFSLPGYHQIDLRVGVRSASTEVYLWVKNLTNSKDFLRGIDFGPLGYAGGYYADPRTYGVTVGVKF